jgi:prepilin-type N-terminal cleavage/methylation domain-containing protein
MQLNKMRTVGKPSGFTLIELLVVIAIIAIIGAIGVPAYNGYIADARDKAAQATLQSIVLMQKIITKIIFVTLQRGQVLTLDQKLINICLGPLKQRVQQHPLTPL